MKRQQNDNLKSRYEQFQTHNKVKNLSSDTIDYYYWNLKMLFEYLQANGMDKITQVDSNAIDNYILNQKKHCKNATSINTHIRAFLYWCMERGLT